MENDSEKYARLQEQQAKAWEEACHRCGACCGTADGDPCEFLVEHTGRKYLCRIYSINPPRCWRGGLMQYPANGGMAIRQIFLK